MLLGRPWLYSAEVVVDWGAKEFAFGKPRIRIPWRTDEYLGETSETDGYTTDWSNPEEESTAFSYFVEQFAETQEADFQFSLPIPEMIQPSDEEKALNFFWLFIFQLKHFLNLEHYYPNNKVSGQFILVLYNIFVKFGYYVSNMSSGMRRWSCLCY